MVNVQKVYGKEREGIVGCCRKDIMHGCKGCTGSVCIYRGAFAGAKRKENTRKGLEEHLASQKPNTLCLLFYGCFMSFVSL